MPERKVAAYTGTKNLYSEMIPAVKSILINSDVDEVWLYIEDDKFPYEMPPMVKTKNISDQKYFKPDGPNMNSPFTYMAMIRATYYKEFPDLDRILSLDVDTIVDKDISSLWNLDLGMQYYLAASREPSRSYRDDIYVNIGVALYNLRKLRDGMGDQVIKALNEGQYTYLEQDVFNQKCKGKIFDMPSEYNATYYTEPTTTPRIVHYAGMKHKDWRELPLVQHYYDVPWEDILAYRKRTYGK